jgi:hypothetical protein
MRTLRTASSLALSLVVALGLVFWAGCDIGGTGSGVSGTVNLKLTDAPADWDSVVVTVDEVQLVPEESEDADDGDDDGEENEEGEENANGIITLTDSNRTVDLLQLQDGRTLDLATGVEVPAGTYTQIRFILGTPNYLVKNGTREPLKVPSGMQSGIKVNLPELEINSSDDLADITLDFDASRSIHKAGRSGKYILRPVINAENVMYNGEAMDENEVEAAGEVTAVTGDSITVEGAAFAVTGETEFDDGYDALSDVSEGDFATVEGAAQDDGFVADEVERQELESDEEPDRAVEGRVESVDADAGTLTVLGVLLQTDDQTVFEGDTFGGVGDLADGDRVTVDFRVENGDRIAENVERDDS